MHSTIQSQRGVSLPGLLLWSIILIITAIFGMKLAPVYIEHNSVQNTLTAIASNPNFKDESPREIRLTFGKHAMIDNISVVNGKDIQISTEKGKRVLTIEYSVTVPLFHNISLLIDFEATSKN